MENGKIKRNGGERKGREKREGRTVVRVGKYCIGHCRCPILLEIYEVSYHFKGMGKVCRLTVHGALSDPPVPQLV